MANSGNVYWGTDDQSAIVISGNASLSIQYLDKTAAVVLHSSNGDLGQHMLVIHPAEGGTTGIEISNPGGSIAVSYSENDDPGGTENQSPSVNAGDNKTITSNTTTLIGTATDPDGSVLFTQWEKVTGPVEPSGTGFLPVDWVPTRTFTVTPTGNGDLVITAGQYAAGDLVLLSGNFRSITVSNLEGAAGNPIVFRNAPGIITTFGNPTWAADGSPSYAIRVSNSRHLVFTGTHWDNFVINGCNNMNIPSGQSEPYKTAYINIHYDENSEFIQTGYMTINNGGTSVVAKTEPIAGASNTWWNGSNPLGYFYFHDMIVQDCFNEAFYIGHSSQYWDITTNPNAPLYPGPYEPAPDSTRYKQARKIAGVKVWNNIVRRCGQDALQISACTDYEVFQNEVSEWATKKNAAHNGGMLIGGRSERANVHDNIFHDSWGEHLQFYGQGIGHIFSNNLCYNTNASDQIGDMASFAGVVGDNSSVNNPAQITVSYNTFARNGTGGSLLRVNGRYNKTGGNTLNDTIGTDNLQVITQNNILVAPKNNVGGDNFDSYYIYTENPQDYDYNTIVTKNNNVQYLTLSVANLNTDNYYLPNSGAVTQGFRKELSLGPVGLTGGSSIVTPNSLTTQIIGLLAGTYVYKLTATDNDGAMASANTQITVNI